MIEVLWRLKAKPHLRIIVDLLPVHSQLETLHFLFVAKFNNQARLAVMFLKRNADIKLAFFINIETF